MSAMPESTITDAYEMLFQGEFDQVTSIVRQWEQKESIDDIPSAWLSLAAMASYLDGKFDEALHYHGAAVKNDADNPGALTALAYFAACCPDESYHDADLAVKLAERACELTQRQLWHYLQILGASYARQGDFARAQQTIEEAMGIAPDHALPRCQKLLNLFREGTPYTGDIRDDYLRSRADWEHRRSLKSP